MNIRTFVEKNEVQRAYNLVNSADILIEAEKAVGATFGPELTEYLLDYGYLGYKSIKFYGLSRYQWICSYMIERTKFLHKYYPETFRLVVFEKRGDDEYSLVDKNDIVYLFDVENRVLTKTNQKLYGYMLQRFQSVY